MKNIFRIITILALVPLMTGCFDDPGTDVTLAEVFVSASVGSFTIAEGGSGEILLEVSQAQSSDLVIDYSITDNNTTNGVDYTLSGTSVTIPAGEYNVSIPFDIEQNIIFEGVSRTVTVEFTSSVSVNGNSEVVITLVDDDCEFIIADWSGTYTVEEVFTSGTNEGLSLAAAFGESYEVVLTADASDPAGLTGTWSNTPGMNTYFDEGTVMTFDPCNVLVAFPGGDPQIAEFANLTAIVSSFDESAKTIRVDGTLGAFGPYGFTLTLQ
ncbi:hypothetical protein [Ekhidna sp.]|uniref:hypothetical protein n=1 Tax=Ekhidna sp. TaxID=2608089 RepID=UPI003297FF14